MIEQTRLGPSGTLVSRLALGTAGFGHWIAESEAASLLHRAVEAGISLIDTAEAYGESEAIIGRALTGNLKKSCLVATKLSIDSIAAAPVATAAIVSQVTGSLRALKRDRIDLLQLHEPAHGGILEHILQVLERLISDGTVARIGLCNHSRLDLQNFLRSAPSRVRSALVSMQNQLSILEPREIKDAVPAAASADLTFLAWSPLGAGMLAHNRRSTSRLWMPWGRDEIEEVRERGAAHQYSARLAKVDPISSALEFVWRSVPGSVAIVGPTTVEQLRGLIGISQMRPNTAV